MLNMIILIMEEPANELSFSSDEAENMPIEDMEKEEEDKVTGYAKFMSHSEKHPDSIKEIAPPIIPIVLPTDNIEELGVVENIFPVRCIVKSNTCCTLDLDNIVVTKDKKIIGFIDDVIGKINEPYYSIMYFPIFLEEMGTNPNSHIVYKQKLYFVPRIMKPITKESINTQGCDASNQYDEEIPEEERECSDDEKERNRKHNLMEQLSKKKKVATIEPYVVTDLNMFH